MKKPFVVDVRPVRSETLRPEEFIELVEQSPGLIESTSIELPRLGAAGFGSIRVNYTRPRYKSLWSAKPVGR